MIEWNIGGLFTGDTTGHSPLYYQSSRGEAGKCDATKWTNNIHCIPHHCKRTVYNKSECISYL